ncbi:MAG: choice-of-anchor D domain-containing protein [Pseudonocardiales bacterium]|nr:choice-of-anchor D domain-containing protein [Pseudonocardiales bacterium]
MVPVVLAASVGDHPTVRNVFQYRPRPAARGCRIARWLARRASAVGTGAAIVVVAGPGVGVALAAATATATFSGAGDHPFTVPVGVTSITVTAVGAKGGNCPLYNKAGTGGAGAAVKATVPVWPGMQLVVGVGGPGDRCGPSTAGGPPAGGGGGGLGGGGGGGPGLGGSLAPGGAGGGGASLVGLASPSPGFPGLLVVAGAGGGAAGGIDGGASGSAGHAIDVGPGSASAGGPGTVTSGGPGGHNDSGFTDHPGVSGSFGFGGGGGGPCSNANVIGGTGGGGGGAGYYGGGGGGCGAAGGSGGGGSSFTVPGAANVSIALSNAAPGVTITYPAPTAEVSATSLHFAPQTPGTAGPPQTLNVANKGSAPLVVSGVLLGGVNPGDFLVADRCRQAVPVGSSCEVGIRFQPQAAGARSARLMLLTNASTAPAEVALSGGPPAGIQLTCKPITVGFTGSARKAAPTEEKCTGKPIRGTGTSPATGASTRATLKRGPNVYAVGARVPGAHGGFDLVLTDRRPLKPGLYTLTIRHRRGRRWIAQRLQVVLR